MTEKLRYSIVEAMNLLELSRSTVYERIATGQLQVVKDGHRVFVMRQELERYLATPLTETATPDKPPLARDNYLEKELERVERGERLYKEELDATKMELQEVRAAFRRYRVRNPPRKRGRRNA